MSAGGGGEPEQHMTQEVEPDHLDHESHFSFYHEHTQALIGGAITTIGLVIVAWIGLKRRSRD